MINHNVHYFLKMRSARE